MSDNDTIVNWQPLLRKHFAFNGANDKTHFVTVSYPVIKESGYMMVANPADGRRIQVNFERVAAMVNGEYLADLPCGYCKELNTVYMYDAARDDGMSNADARRQEYKDLVLKFGNDMGDLFKSDDTLIEWRKQFEAIKFGAPFTEVVALSEKLIDCDHQRVKEWLHWATNNSWPRMVYAAWYRITQENISTSDASTPRPALNGTGEEGEGI